MHIRDQKSHLRQAIRERLAKLPEKERLAEGRTLCRELLNILPKEPFTLCAYFPLKDEADMRPLLLALLQRGCALYLPRFEGKTFVFRKAENLQELPKGILNIPEPAEDAPLLDPLSLAYALIPARAYTPSGERLGRGNGGYDHWIRAQRAAHPKTVFIGVALECQIVREMPTEEHDERVDMVVTARGRMKNG